MRIRNKQAYNNIQYMLNNKNNNDNDEEDSFKQFFPSHLLFS